MKKGFILLLFFSLVLSLAHGQGGNTDTQAEREARRQQRVEQRQQRMAEYMRYIDSIILSRNYEFSPSSMQLEPAGRMHFLYNVSFGLSIYPDWADIYLPYIKGLLPPYYPVILNYALPGLRNYTAIQNEAGWTITFSTWLYSASLFNFTLEIYSSAGTAVLTIASDIYNTVSYNGSITGVY